MDRRHSPIFVDYTGRRWRHIRRAALVAGIVTTAIGLVLVGTPGKSPREMADKIMASMEADYDKVTGAYWTKLLHGARPAVEHRVRHDMKRVDREAALVMMRAIFVLEVSISFICCTMRSSELLTSPAPWADCCINPAT